MSEQFDQVFDAIVSDAISASAKPELEVAQEARVEPLEEPPPAGAEPEPTLPAALEISDGVWERALDRIERGEGVKDVGEKMGLDWRKLRAKWAGAVSSGARRKREPASRPSKPSAVEEADTDDEPVSGGLGAVLARGRHDAWSEEADSTILAAEPGDLGRLAKSFGRPVSAVKARKAQLEAGAQRMMREA